MILSAKNLSKSFQSPQTLQLFKGLSLELLPGESVAIVGKSGVGKTTLLHILGTLDWADEGSVQIHNTKLSRKNMAQIRNQSIGFIFQSYHLLDDFTALENVLMPARIARKSVHASYGLDLLDQVGLLDRAHQKISTLSGGERQRVAIARALCNDPDLLLADEPSGNLDQANTEMIGKLLIELTQKKKKALVLVTHDLSLAALCQRTYELKDGLLKSLTTT